MLNKKTFLNSFKRALGLLLLAAIWGNVFSVAGQTGRRQPANRKSPRVTRPPQTPIVVKSEAACKGGYSGVIKYSQTLDDKGSKIEPINKNGKDFVEHKWSQDLSYRGTLVVDGSDPIQPRANGTVKFEDTRMRHGIEKTWGSCGAWKPEHWFVIDSKTDETEGGKGGGAAKSFNLSVDEARGTYNFSFQLPDVPGEFKREDRSRPSGHCQPKNNEPSDRDIKTAIVVEGKTGRVENQKIDPKNPDVLEGGVTIDRNDYSNPNNIKTPIIKISWKLRRCSPPLVITDLKFYHLRYPSPNDWKEIGYNDYTIDGNEVKIEATIANFSGTRKSATVNFKELKENADLPQGQIAAEFEPHQIKTVEYLWDTSGYAWKEASPWNQREPLRNIEVRIPDDRQVEEVEVRPKPVVVIPGMWSKYETMDKFVNYFNPKPNEPWAVQIAPVAPTATAMTNAPVIDKTVRALQEKENAWHVDLVAHSTGGLGARAYVHDLMPSQYDGRPTATHLVMIGTPNMGSPCSSGVENIVTKFFNRSARAFNEISFENMRAFNQKIFKRHGTKFSILVAISSDMTCQMDAVGDGVTPTLSAMWTIKEWKYSTVNAPHDLMPGEQANFIQVYKWLAVPPNGIHGPDNRQAFNNNFNDDNSADWREESFGKLRRYGAMFRPASFQESPGGDDEPEPNFATGVKLAANETKEIEIPVTNGSRFSLVLYTTPNVSATLIDDKGEMLGKNLAGSPEAAEIFRTITVKKAFQNGKWKLRLENRDAAEAEIAVTAFIDYSSSVFKQSDNLN